MDSLEKAIMEITYLTSKYPEEAIRIIEENPEAAKPYLREAIDRAIALKDDVEDNYELHFYGLFLLGEFQDKESFEKIMEFAALPPETLDTLLGGGITEGLNDILYNTYNGNLKLLKQSIWNPRIDDFVRAAMLDVMGQLYLDGTLGKDELQSFLKEIIYHEEEIGDYIYEAIVSTIFECHFVDMLPDIRYLYDNDMVDISVHGEYDSCVDLMFRYDDSSVGFCESPMSVARLKGWAMFEEEEPQRSGADLDKLYKAWKKEFAPEPKIKIGRNDPCPCGSGRKYKHCCLNKPKSELDQIESAQERKKWLKGYPPVALEKTEGRVYIDDIYDEESIEIDKLLYLALMHRPGFIWERDSEEAAKAKKKAYLCAAFSLFMEKMEKEGLTDCKDFDKKFSIHYLCMEWMEELACLLDEPGDKEKKAAVLKYCGSR